VTLSNYCRKGRSTLERGQDFTIKRLGPWRRQLAFTDAGIARLLARDYNVSYRGPVRKRNTWLPPKLKPLETLGEHERRMRLEHSVALALTQYLKIGGCAVRGCPCVIHTALGVPQADYIAAIMPPRRPLKR
jgi:hypothetical protein